MRMRRSRRRTLTHPPESRHTAVTLPAVRSLQGPSRPPRGGACAVSGPRPDEAGPPRHGCRGGRSCSGSRAPGGRPRSRSRRRGVEVVAADRSADADPGRLAEAGVEVRSGTEEESLLEGVELVMKSPGVPARVAARRGCACARGMPIWSEVELGYRLLRGNPLIGVTGTNGKTTTTELLGAILRAAGRPRRGRRQRRPRAHRRRRADRAGRRRSSASSRASSSRTCTRSRATSPCSSTSSPTTSTVTAASRRTATRSSASSSARARRSCRAARGSRASSSRPTIRCPPSRCIPGAHNRENAAAATAAARACGGRRRRDRRGASHVRGRSAPARARARAARRPLRQRLEGDEHRRRPTRRRPPTATRRCA